MERKTGRGTALVVADAIRRHPDGRTLLLADEAARSAALATPGTDEERLLAWAMNTGAACRLAGLVHACRRLGLWIAGAVLAIAAILGLGAAGTALGRGLEHQINVPLALLGLVGAQLGFLLLWILASLWLTLRRSDTAAGLVATGLPGRALSASLALLGRLRKDGSAANNDREAVLAAIGATLEREAFGRWLLSSLTHVAWLVFSLAAFLGCWMYLSIIQYDFGWGTTIQSTETAVAVLTAVGWLPERLGLTMPDATMVEAIRHGGVAGEAERRAWGQFLLGSILVYGVLPRLLLTAFCALRATRSLAAMTLDQGHSLFQSALLELRRSERPGKPAGERTTDVQRRVRTVTPATRFGGGSYFATLAVELDDPETPAPLAAIREQVSLGHIRTRHEARKAIADLRSLDPEPRFLLVLASLARTPDRGTTDLLGELAAAARAPVLLVLAELELLAGRGIDRERREADWRTRIAGAGVNAVLVANQERLAAMDRDALEGRIRASGTMGGGHGA